MTQFNSSLPPSTPGPPPQFNSSDIEISGQQVEKAKFDWKEGVEQRGDRQIIKATVTLGGKYYNISVGYNEAALKQKYGQEGATSEQFVQTMQKIVENLNPEDVIKLAVPEVKSASISSPESTRVFLAGDRTVTLNELRATNKDFADSISRIVTAFDKSSVSRYIQQSRAPPIQTSGHPPQRLSSEDTADHTLHPHSPPHRDASLVHPSENSDPITVSGPLHVTDDSDIPQVEGGGEGAHPPQTEVHHSPPHVVTAPEKHVNPLEHDAGISGSGNPEGEIGTLPSNAHDTVASGNPKESLGKPPDLVGEAEGEAPAHPTGPQDTHISPVLPQNAAHSTEKPAPPHESPSHNPSISLVKTTHASEVSGQKAGVDSGKESTEPVIRDSVLDAEERPRELHAQSPTGQSEIKETPAEKEKKQIQTEQKRVVITLQQKIKNGDKKIKSEEYKQALIALAELGKDGVTSFEEIVLVKDEHGTMNPEMQKFTVRDLMDELAKSHPEALKDKKVKASVAEYVSSQRSKLNAYSPQMGDRLNSQYAQIKSEKDLPEFLARFNDFSRIAERAKYTLENIPAVSPLEAAAENAAPADMDKLAEEYDTLMKKFEELNKTPDKNKEELEALKAQLGANIARTYLLAAGNNLIEAMKMANSGVQNSEGSKQKLQLAAFMLLNDQLTYLQSNAPPLKASDISFTSPLEAAAINAAPADLDKLGEEYESLNNQFENLKANPEENKEQLEKLRGQIATNLARSYFLLAENNIDKALKMANKGLEGADESTREIHKAAVDLLEAQNKHSKNLEQLSRVLTEIYESEVAHANGIFPLVYANWAPAGSNEAMTFFKRLEHEGLITREERDLLESNWNDAAASSESIIRGLSALKPGSEASTEEKMAVLISQFSSSNVNSTLQNLALVTSKQDVTTKIMERVKNNKKGAALLTKFKERNEQIDITTKNPVNIDVNATVIKPVQRAPRYFMLLREVQKYSSGVSENARNALTMDMENLSNKGTAVNEMLRIT